jgi:serine/threonine protein kinase
MKGESELGKEVEGTTTGTPNSIPPRPEELARQFPQLEILELLGQGGMGIVYKARQPRLDRFVALKILPAEAGRDPAFAERFAREARALAKLSHPNIVTVYDFGESEGRFYLLMEFVDGVNLRHLLRERRLKPEEALKIVPQICEALQYAHEQGVVHRDIKPENILLDKRGHIKIADFGLAKLLGQKSADSALTGSQQIMGTLHYMAPEQMEKPLTVDHRADIYSLGVVFYEMLTGELPLGRFAPPSQKVQLDVRLDEVVLRALEKEPERRYQHASDVKAEVEIITHTDSQQERPVVEQARLPRDSEIDQLEHLVLPFLPENKVDAIKVYHQQSGASLAEAKKAVEAIARKHGLHSASWDWIGIAGLILSISGIGSLFLPYATVHLRNVVSAGHPRGNPEWTSYPSNPLFGWVWTTLMGTFLTLGLYLFGTYAVRRLGRQRNCILMAAGIVVFGVNAFRVQGTGESQLLGLMHVTLSVGFYVTAALGVALLSLGVIALRLAPRNSVDRRELRWELKHVLNAQKWETIKSSIDPPHLLSLLLCVLGSVDIFQSIVPFGELQVLTVQSINEHRATGAPLAQVFGYESTYTITIGVILGSLCALLIATGAVRFFLFWRASLLILAGIGSILLMVWSIRSSGYDHQAADNFREHGALSGRYGFVVLGEHLTVNYTWPDKFQVWEKTVIVKDLPGGMGPPPGLTKIVIRYPAYLVIGIGCGLIMLGSIQMRATSKLPHVPNSTKESKP